jgi:hypothetical protein
LEEDVASFVKEVPVALEVEATPLVEVREHPARSEEEAPSVAEKELPATVESEAALTVDEKEVPAAAEEEAPVEAEAAPAVDDKELPAAADKAAVESEASEKGCARATEVAPETVEAPTETENLDNKVQSAIEDTGDSLKLNCGLKVDAKALGVELVSFDEALATADFISLQGCHADVFRRTDGRTSGRSDDGRGGVRDLDEP